MSDTGGFPIIGVGASAGGLEALERLLRGIPDQPGLALVIVTHLNPDRESMLHGIVKRFTGLPVEVCTDDQAVGVDRVYVMPPNAILGIEHRRLRLRRNASQRERKPSTCS